MVTDAETNRHTDMLDAGVYNMAGQRMSGLHKGLNIVNGRKVICR